MPDNFFSSIPTDGDTAVAAPPSKNNFFSQIPVDSAPAAAALIPRTSSFQPSQFSSGLPLGTSPSDNPDWALTQSLTDPKTGIIARGQKPFIPIPSATVKPDDGVLTAVGKEAYNLAKSIPEFIESPLGLATLPVAAEAKGAKVLAGAFGLNSAKDLGQQIISAHQNWGDYTPSQKAAALTDMAGTGAFATFLGKTALKKGAAVEPKLPNENQPNNIAPPNPPPLDTAPIAPEAKTASEPVSAPADTSEPLKVQPALKINGKVYTGGDTHYEIKQNLPQDAKDDYLLHPDAPDVDSQHIFLDQNGNELSRTDLQKAIGVSDSESIPAANKIPKPLTPDEVSAQTGANYDGEIKNSSGESVKGFTFKNPSHPLKGVTFNLKGDVTPDIVAAKMKELNDRFSGDSEHTIQEGEGGKFNIVNPSGKTLEAFPNRAEAEKVLPEYNTPGIPSEVDAITKKNGGQAELPTQPPADMQTAKVSEQNAGEAKPAQAGAAPAVEPSNNSATGLAARVRAPREQAGMTAPTVTGKGIAPEASVERGKQLMQSGADPEAAMQEFEKSNRASSDDFALARAHQDQLARATNQAEEKFGRDSKEFQDAYKTESDWSARTKAMQTEWAKSGHAQQGEVDIDTGTFSGIKRAYREAHDGKELPAKDEKKAQELADANKKLADENTALLKELSNKIETETAPKVEPHVKLVADKLKGFFETGAKSALERIQARRAEGRLFTGIDPAELGDYAIYGASKILSKGIEGAEMSAEWAKEMAQEVGDFIKPHLKQIWDASKKSLEDSLKKAAGKGDTAKKVIKAAKEKPVSKIPTVESVHESLSDYKGGKMTPEQVRAIWQYAKKNYIDKGTDNFGEIVRKVSTDLGMKHADVANGLAQPKGLKIITNELWRKQADARRVNEAAKQWLRDKDTPALSQTIPRIARLMFGAKVFGHGGVAFGTHAPMVAFIPRYTKSYLRDFGKMYKMVFSQAEYEKNVQALRSEKNYTVAQRAGLVNDPYKVEDFNNPKMTGYYGKVSGAGNRGYFALKVLRQDMFDQGWNKLPETVKTPEMAKAMADDINHITGVVKAGAGNKASMFLFAPKLLMSRAAFAVGDPYKAVEIASTAMSPAKWAALPPEQKFHVINQVKQKATILGTAFGLLLANQALLSAMGSKQKVNMTDPTKSDFMKFKAAGMQFSYGNAMLNMLRLPLRMWTIGAGDGGKMKKIIYPDESMYSAAGEFARSQASPMAGLGLDLLFKGDYQNRPLPQIPGYGKPIPLPKRLAAEGIKPYTWPEFFLEQASPIPFEEAEREVFRTGFGFSDAQLKQLAKAAGTTLVMMGTGGRLNEDLQPKPAAQPRPKQ